MPFLHRFRGTSGRRPDVRELAAWDTAKVDLPDYSAADFEPGVSLPTKRTLFRDGAHWANILGTTLGADMLYNPDEDGMAPAMARLANAIDCSRFFDDGIALPSADTLSKMPLERHVEWSQRDSNVARLREWADENLASIDGELFVKVREPTLRLMAYSTSVETEAYLHVRIDRFKPILAKDDFGVLFRLGERDTLVERTAEIVESNPVISHVVTVIDELDWSAMTEDFPQGSDVERRTIVSTGNSVGIWGIRGQAGMKKDPASEELRLLASLDETSADISDLESAADILSVQRIEPASHAIIVREAVRRWHDRTVHPELSTGPMPR